MVETLVLFAQWDEIEKTSCVEGELATVFKDEKLQADIETQAYDALQRSRISGSFRIRCVLGNLILGKTIESHHPDGSLYSKIRPDNFPTIPFLNIVANTSPPEEARHHYLKPIRAPDAKEGWDSWEYHVL